jgi:hypothetical protein
VVLSLAVDVALHPAAVVGVEQAFAWRPPSFRSGRVMPVDGTIRNAIETAAPAA